MVKEKFSKLLSSFKEVYKARKAKLEAQYKISSVMPGGKTRSCMKGLLITNPESSLFPIDCESFKYDKICENNACPMIAKNMKYIAARENYESARRVFIQELFFWRTKTK